MKILRYITACVLILALSASLIYCNFIHDDGTSNPPVTEDNGDDENNNNTSVTVGNRVGQKCPAYALELVDGSGTINIRDLEGKIVIVNFWGTWCGPCKQELPDFDQIAEEYSEDVVVLTIHSVYSKGNAPAYIEQHFPNSKMLFAYDVPLTSDIDMYFDLLGGTSFYPRTLILDENGVIVFTYDGRLEHSTLVSIIEETKNK